MAAAPVPECIPALFSTVPFIFPPCSISGLLLTGGPIEVDEGEVRSIGSPGIDSEALVKGCIVVLLSELCVADPPKALLESTCALIPRGVKRDGLIAKWVGANRLEDDGG